MPMSLAALFWVLLFLLVCTSRVGSELARLCLSTREVDRCDKDEMTSSYNLDKLARCLTVIRLEVKGIDFSFGPTVDS